MELKEPFRKASSIKEVGEFRELIRQLERRLGFLDQVQSTCCGLSLSQCHTLVEIGRASPLSLHELSLRLGVDKSTASRVVETLVVGGMVERIPQPDDRRSVQIFLTTTGRAMFYRIEQEMNQLFESVFASIPVEKRPQVLETLSLLLENLPSLKCCRGDI